MLAVISRAAAAIKWFSRWWFGELAGLVPSSMRHFFRSRADTVVVDISGPEIVIFRCDDTACEEIGRFPQIDMSSGRSDEDPAPSVTRMLAAAGPKRQKIALRLSADQTLRKHLSLPIAAQDNLREILSHQIEQVTPFQAHEACFGYRIASRDRGTGQIEVELTVAPKKYVDAALSQVRMWGFRPPEIVDISNHDPLSPPEINLIAGNGAAARSDPWPRINLALVTLAAILAGTAIFIPLERARVSADKLLGEVTELRQASKEVFDLRSQRDALRKNVHFIADQKLARPSVLKILDELTRIIPKDAWLYELRVNRPEIRISGYSPSSSSLIGRINDSPMFNNPRFRSPVTRPANTDKERFNLSFVTNAGRAPGGK